MLGRTEEGLYHGHVVEFKKLQQTVKNTLIESGFISKKGKILRKDLL